MDKITIAIAGDAGCGKTTLVHRFVYNKFINNTECTIGMDLFKKDILIDDKQIHLEIYDTAGQERFRSLGRSYYQRAHGIILTFDITISNSFDSLESILKDIRYYNPNAEVILVSTKHDMSMSRYHDKFKLSDFIKDNNLSYYQANSRNGTNVDHIFRHLAKNILNREKDFASTNSISLSIPSIKSTKETLNYFTYGYCF